MSQPWRNGANWVFLSMNPRHSISSPYGQSSARKPMALYFDLPPNAPEDACNLHRHTQTLASPVLADESDHEWPAPAGDPRGNRPNSRISRRN